MKIKDKLSKISGSWYFLITVVLIHFLFSIFSKEIFLDSLVLFYELIYRIVPIFIFIFIFMTLSNYFITPKFIIKHLKKKGIKKWIFMIAGGILSSGPIYMWYPLLSDLKDKGLSYGLITCFLYNRAIKIPLLPLAIIYFSWQYLFVLTIVMIFVSIVQGILIDKLMGVEDENSDSL